jgi:hypothetical protein
MKPQLLGYIFDVIVKVLKWKEANGDLDASKIPRMADWAAHCEIISRCMGNEEGEFLKAYEQNAKIQTEQVIETSLVATCLAHFVNTDPRFNGDGSLAMFRDLEGNVWGWKGISSMLKGELDAVAPRLSIDIKNRGWPKNPSWLVRRINEIVHTLKDAGIEIAFDHSDPMSKSIMIRKVPSMPSMASKNGNHAQDKNTKLDGKDAIDANLHVTEGRPNTCEKCGEPLDSEPYYAKLHNCENTN